MQNWKVTLTVFSLTWLLMSGSYTLMYPFLPVYLLNDLGCPEEDLTFWSSACFSIQFVFSALLSPVWGRIADRYGRKLMLLRASSMLAVSYFICLIVQTPLQLFFARCFMGIGCGITPVILAMTSDAVPREKLGFSMGVLQSMNVLGTVVGPLAGGMIAQYLSVRYTFVITTCALTAITLLCLIFIHEPRRKPVPQPEMKKLPSVGIWSVLTNRNILTVLMISAAAYLILMLQAAILTPYVTQMCGEDGAGIALSGVVFSLQGIAGALAAPMWGVQGQRRGFFRCLCAAMLLSSVFYTSMYLPSSLLPFAVLEFFAGLCLAGIVPMINALLVQASSPAERTTSFGLLYTFQELGAGSGPLVGGFIAALLGTQFVFLLGGGMMLCFAVLVICLTPQALRVRQIRKVHP